MDSTELAHLSGVIAALLGLFALAARRSARGHRLDRPSTEAIVGWLFFALVGAFAWSAGMLTVHVGFRIVALLAVLVLARRTWGVTRDTQWAGMAGIILLAAAMSVLFRAHDRSAMLLVGAVLLVAARLVQGREWALLQARARETVIRQLSHALRTPAAAIHSLADALAAGAIDDAAERQRFLALIQSEAARLTTGLERVLRTAHGDRSVATIAPAQIDLAEWARATAERWRVRLPTLALAIGDGAAVVATADAERLDEAIDALLDNAMRYGRDPVTLGVQRTPARVEIVVEDGGEGPPAKVREKLAADGDAPLDPETVRGFGLGLAAAREIARAHGGGLELATPSRAVLWLPVAA